MLHPSYTDLMETINSETEGDTPVVNSRYSIVLATAKRARQLIAGEEAYVKAKNRCLLLLKRSAKDLLQSNRKQQMKTRGRLSRRFM